MTEYDISSVVWYERDDQIYVTYDHEEPDHMVATQKVATELARDAGLSLVPAPAGICRWVRNPPPGTDLAMDQDNVDPLQRDA